MHALTLNKSNRTQEHETQTCSKFESRVPEFESRVPELSKCLNNASSAVETEEQRSKY